MKVSIHCVYSGLFGIVVDAEGPDLHAALRSAITTANNTDAWRALDDCGPTTIEAAAPEHGHEDPANTPRVITVPESFCDHGPHGLATIRARPGEEHAVRVEQGLVRVRAENPHHRVDTLKGPQGYDGGAIDVVLFPDAPPRVRCSNARVQLERVGYAEMDGLDILEDRDHAGLNACALRIERWPNGRQHVAVEAGTPQLRVNDRALRAHHGTPGAARALLEIEQPPTPNEETGTLPAPGRVCWPGHEVDVTRLDNQAPATVAARWDPDIGNAPRGARALLAVRAITIKGKGERRYRVSYPWLAAPFGIGAIWKGPSREAVFALEDPYGMICDLAEGPSPVLIHPHDFGAWLNPHTSAEDLEAIAQRGAWMDFRIE